MSNNVKRKVAGVKQPLVKAFQRVRESRHGKPHVHRSLGARTVKWTAEGAVIVHARGPLVPVTKPFEVLVAQGPTSSYGQKNTGGANAGKKSAKPLDK